MLHTTRLPVVPIRKNSQFNNPVGFRTKKRRILPVTPSKEVFADFAHRIVDPMSPLQSRIVMSQLRQQVNIPLAVNTHPLRHFNDVFSSVVLFTGTNLSDFQVLSRYGFGCTYAYVPSSGICRVAVVDGTQMSSVQLVPRIQEALMELDSSSTDSENAKNTQASVTHVLCITSHGSVCSVYLAVRLKSTFDCAETFHSSNCDYSNGLEYNMRYISSYYMIPGTILGVPGYRCKRVCPDVVPWLVVIETDSPSGRTETAFLASPAYYPIHVMFSNIDHDLYVEQWKSIPTVALVTPNPLGSGYVANYYTHGVFSNMCASVCSMHISAVSTRSVRILSNLYPGMPMFLRSWGISTLCTTYVRDTSVTERSSVACENLPSHRTLVENMRGSSKAFVTYFGLGTGVRMYACISFAPVVEESLFALPDQCCRPTVANSTCELVLANEVIMHEWAAKDMRVLLDRVVNRTNCELPHGCKAVNRGATKTVVYRKSLCADPSHKRTYPQFHECVFVPVYSMQKLGDVATRIRHDWMLSCIAEGTSAFPVNVHHAMVCVHMGNRLLHRCYASCSIGGSQLWSFGVTIPKHTLKYMAENYRTAGACVHIPMSVQTVSVVILALDCETYGWVFTGRLCLDFMPGVGANGIPNMSATVDPWPVADCAGKDYNHRSPSEVGLLATEVGENDILLTFYGGSYVPPSQLPRLGPESLVVLNAMSDKQPRSKFWPVHESPPQELLNMLFMPDVSKDDLTRAWKITAECAKPRSGLFHDFSAYLALCAALSSEPSLLFLVVWCGMVINSNFTLCMAVNAMRNPSVYAKLLTVVSTREVFATIEYFFRAVNDKNDAAEFLKNSMQRTANLYTNIFPTREQSTSPRFITIISALASVVSAEVEALNAKLKDCKEKVKLMSVIAETQPTISESCNESITVTNTEADEIVRKLNSVEKKYRLDIACSFFARCSKMDQPSVEKNTKGKNPS